MGRSPCCAKVGIKKGAWTALEDKVLTSYIKAHGACKWRSLPKRAGLKRCGKSCRLRWFNYLRPDIKRGNITREEEDLIIRLHNLLGNRWSLIAGRLPGRTDNEIKNYWNTTLKKRLPQADCSYPSPAICKENKNHPSTEPRITERTAAESSSRRPLNSPPAKVTGPLVTPVKPIASCTNVPVPSKPFPDENHQLMLTPIATDLPQVQPNRHQSLPTSQHVQESKNSGAPLNVHCGTQDDLGFFDFESNNQFSFNFPSDANNYKPQCLGQENSESWRTCAYCIEEEETLDLESLAYFLNSEEWP